MKKFRLLLLLSFGFFFQGYAQNRLIKGKVTDEYGKPLHGATVIIRNTTISTTTDSLGEFQITTNGQKKSALVVSFVGYSTEELLTKEVAYFSIHLEQLTQSLNDVVVVGYGEQRKRDVTGAISSVKADEIAKRPIVRVEQALQGTTAGVAVQSVNGMPGTPLSVRIRGVNSITGSNEPLYVIDGYIGADALNILPTTGIRVDILTKPPIFPPVKTLCQAFKTQHGSLTVKTSLAFHDRFVVIDDSVAYHFGASIKDLGKKTFMFSLIEEPDILAMLHAKLGTEWGNAMVEV